MSYMNIGKFIRQLLPEYKTVIFPGLGAFFLKYTPAKIDAEAKVIFSPSGKLGFNSEIKNDDGLLAGHLARTENISIREANLKIREAGDEILYQLDKGGKVEIESLGALFYDENREIQFEPLPGEIPFSETFGLEHISMLSRTEIISQLIAGVSESVAQSEEPVADHAETDAIEDNTEIVAVPPAQEQPETSPKKRRGWLWLLPLLLLAVAILFFLLRKEKEEIQAPKQEAAFLAEDEKIPADEPQDSLVADSFFEADVSVADSITAGEVEITGSLEFAKPDTSMYYLIGGSFSKIENAEEYFLEMKEKGYNPLYLGKSGSFYLVSIQVFENRAEAFREQYDFLDRLPDSGVWVYKPEKVGE